MKKILFLFLTALVLVSEVFARDINFQIIQDNPGQEDVFDTSLLFEQAMADFFFESGHIVSNTPVYIRTDDVADKAEIKRALIESLLGSMELLVRVQIIYNPEKAKNPKAMVLDGISEIKWTAYSVKNGKLLSSGSDKPGYIDEKNNNENGIYNFGSSVASKISSGLRNTK